MRLRRELVSELLSFHDLRRFDHRVQQHLGPGGGPFLADLLGLVVAQPVDAGAHHHRRRRHAVDPAGVVAGAGFRLR